MKNEKKKKEKRVKNEKWKVGSINYTNITSLVKTNPM